MLGLKSNTEFQRRLLQQEADKGAFLGLTHAAASLRKRAASVIEKSPEASPAGFPPHTRRGLLARAIRFAVSADNTSAVIGPRASIVGTSGAAHEVGGIYKGTKFEKRPFMGPSLAEAVPRFAGSFRGSIG